CDAVIVSDPQHLVYFANFAISPFEFRANDAGALLLMRPGHATLIADNLLDPHAERAHVDERWAAEWYTGRSSAPDRRGLLVRAARQALAKWSPRRLGIEPGSLPVGVLEEW